MSDYLLIENLRLGIYSRSTIDSFDIQDLAPLNTKTIIDMKKHILSLILLLFFFHCPKLVAQWTELPENMYADTLHAPFIYGVASGDPLKDGVIIWTKLEPEVPIPLNITWEVSTTADMSQVVQEGFLATDADKAWTVKVDVSGLNPNTYYYYRFKDTSDNYSIVGRTKTAPDGMVDQLNFATTSCTSIYSGFFNAYKKIAERDNLDGVIHVGDYIYDYPDQDEEVRIPMPYPIDPLYLDEWRQLHTYYLLDPDLRAARQQHPFIVIWDNHDIDTDTEEQFDQAVQAFHEHLPTRPNPDAPNKIYRSLHYGDLLDIMMIDAEQFSQQDEIGEDEFSILGTEQYDWLTNELENSFARWRIIGNQKLFNLWSVEGSPVELPIGNGEVVDPGSWDGYQLEREQLMLLLRDYGIGNNIVLSGDLHFFMATDMAIYPLNENMYNPLTGFGSVGVEFMGGSMSRGNLDEAGYAATLSELLLELSFDLNPHHVYANLIDHGYGTLRITPDDVIAQAWLVDKLEQSDEEVMDTALIVRNGTNTWERGWVFDPSVLEDTTSTTSVNTLDAPLLYTLSPNPGKQDLNLNIQIVQTEKAQLEIVELSTGKIIRTESLQLIANQNQQLKFKTNDWATGVYLLKLKGKTVEAIEKWVKVK